MTVLAQRSVQCIQVESESECAEFMDSATSELMLRDKVLDLRSQGFLEAGLDSQYTSNDTLFSLLHKGIMYKTLKLNKHNLPQTLLDSSTKELNIKELKRTLEQLITYYEGIGYPFASVVINNSTYSGGELQAELFFDKGIEVRYDSIEVVGSAELSSKYLSKYLNLPQGGLYNESQVKRIDKLLRNLPLVKVKRNARVYFYQGLARVVLSLDKQTTDRFDGVVGLAPNSNNSTANNLLITGEVNLELNNLFKSAKQFDLHWKNYLERSQSLDLGITWPYLFNTRLGINSTFYLNKFDTLFINIRSRIGFRYQQQGNNYIQFYYEYSGSNLITVDTNAVRSSGRLPSNNPYRIDNYGLSLNQLEFDYRPNPRSGYFLNADLSIGLKQLLRNSLVDAVQFNHPDRLDPISIYDTARLRNTRAKFEFEGILFTPLFKRTALMNKLSFGGIFASNTNFNEFFSFGGFSDLNGFDEKEIFGSKFMIHRIEYRYLFSQNGNVGLFFNTALYENRLEEDKLVRDIPYGFGISANLEVGGGVLSMAYALGSRLDNPIVLNSAKIHFGLINYF